MVWISDLSHLNVFTWFEIHRLQGQVINFDKSFIKRLLNIHLGWTIDFF